MWMKKMQTWLLGLLLVFSLPLSSLGQCPGGCPVDISDLPPIEQSLNTYGPVEAVGYLSSVVRIYCVEGDGLSIGSGVYVNYENMLAVVTANHVTGGAQKIYVAFSTGEVSNAVVIHADPLFDCSVLILKTPPKKVSPVTIAYGDAGTNLKGTLLQNVGYGPDGVLSSGTGYFKRYTHPNPGDPADWVVIGSIARPGDSGGPIFNPQGQVVAILWGSDFESVIVGVSCGRLHVILTEAKKNSPLSCPVRQPRPVPRQPKKIRPIVPREPPALPWRQKIEDIIRDLQRQVGGLRPVVPVVPPSVDVDVDVNPQPEAEQAEVRKRVARHIALPIILCLVLVSCAIGFGVQWKKTYN